MQNYPPSGAPNYSPAGMPQGPAPKSKKPWIIGGVIGCLLLIVLLLVALGGLGYYASRNLQSTQNANVAPPTKAANTKQYVNTRQGRSGNLADNFVDFSFYYPDNWELDPNPAPNFVRVERKITGDDGNFTQENFAVGWVSATGTALDKQLMPQLATQFNTQFAAQFPNYKKVSEGETKIGAYEGYEFRFTAEKNNVGARRHAAAALRAEEGRRARDDRVRPRAGIVERGRRGGEGRVAGHPRIFPFRFERVEITSVENGRNFRER
jgi:hypothetical protein